MSRYFIQKFGAEVCDWILKTESYVFGDIVAHALLNVPFDGVVHIFIHTYGSLLKNLKH